MPQNDSSLVERCIRKDPLAWAELVKRYSRLISLSIENIFKKYSFPHSKSDVDDVLQNILILIWKGNKLRTIKNRRDISYWLAIVSGNMALNYMRLKASRERYDTVSMHQKLGEGLLNEAVEAIASDGPTPLDEAVRKEIAKSLKESFGKLSHTEQIIAKLNLFHKKTYAETARITHRPIGTVANTVKRIKNELKRGLKKYL